MENNIFLDKVVEFLVRDSKMDYDKVKYNTPFYLLIFFHIPFLTTPPPSSLSTSLLFKVLYRCIWVNGSRDRICMESVYKVL
jgi:hypothetical protein